MDNKEFAKILLCEATELLEGAQVEAYKQKKKEELYNSLDKQDSRRMHEMYSKDGKSKVYNAATTRGFASYDANEGRSITKAEENGLDKKSALKHKNRMEDIAQQASEITRREAKRRDLIAKQSGHVYDKNFDDNYKIAMDATNKHLRRHGKKSQNESIAILLTEAALLLTEAVGVKDRSTDKIVKTFKTNEEAANWVNNNGGNDRYQLTNRLK